MKLILLVIGLIFCAGVSAQESSYSILSTTPPSSSVDFLEKPFSGKTGFDFRKASNVKIKLHQTTSKIPSVDHLPSLFCKLEYQIESKSKLAPRFRLGSLAYTQWMEGKTDYYTLFNQ